MTNTTFGKKLLLIATITVLVSGLTFATSLSDASADPKVPKEPKEKKNHLPTGTQDFKCKESIGSFFNPLVTSPLLISTSEGKCNKFFGHMASSTITTFDVDGIPSASNCVNLETLDGVDSYAIGKKGSWFTFSMKLEQCFFESDGLTPTTAFLTGAYCDTGVSTDVFTSTVTGTYDVTGGQHNDKHGNTEITGGSGTITSSVDHCAMNNAPYGNSVVTEMTGTTVFGAIVP